MSEIRRGDLSQEKKPEFKFLSKEVDLEVLRSAVFVDRLFSSNDNDFEAAVEIINKTVAALEKEASRAGKKVNFEKPNKREKKFKSWRESGSLEVEYHQFIEHFITTARSIENSLASAVAPVEEDVKKEETAEKSSIPEPTKNEKGVRPQKRSEKAGKARGDEEKKPSSSGERKTDKGTEKERMVSFEDAQRFLEKYRKEWEELEIITPDFILPPPLDSQDQEQIKKKINFVYALSQNAERARKIKDSIPEVSFKEAKQLVGAEEKKLSLRKLLEKAAELKAAVLFPGDSKEEAYTRKTAERILTTRMEKDFKEQRARMSEPRPSHLLSRKVGGLESKEKDDRVERAVITIKKFNEEWLPSNPGKTRVKSINVEKLAKGDKAILFATTAFCLSLMEGKTEEVAKKRYEKTYSEMTGKVLPKEPMLPKKEAKKTVRAEEASSAEVSLAPTTVTLTPAEEISDREEKETAKLAIKGLGTFDNDEATFYFENEDIAPFNFKNKLKDEVEVVRAVSNNFNDKLYIIELVLTDLDGGDRFSVGFTLSPYEYKNETLVKITKRSMSGALGEAKDDLTAQSLRKYFENELVPYIVQAKELRKFDRKIKHNQEKRLSPEESVSAPVAVLPANVEEFQVEVGPVEGEVAPTTTATGVEEPAVASTVAAEPTDTTFLAPEEALSPKEDVVEPQRPEVTVAPQKRDLGDFDREMREIEKSIYSVGERLLNELVGHVGNEIIIDNKIIDLTNDRLHRPLRIDYNPKLGAYIFEYNNKNFLRFTNVQGGLLDYHSSTDARGVFEGSLRLDPSNLHATAESIIMVIRRFVALAAAEPTAPSVPPTEIKKEKKLGFIARILGRKNKL